MHCSDLYFLFYFRSLIIHVLFIFIFVMIFILYLYYLDISDIQYSFCNHYSSILVLFCLYIYLARSFVCCSCSICYSSSLFLLLIYFVWRSIYYLENVPVPYNAFLVSCSAFYTLLICYCIVSCLYYIQFMASSRSLRMTAKQAYYILSLTAFLILPNSDAVSNVALLRDFAWRYSW